MNKTQHEIAVVDLAQMIIDQIDRRMNEGSRECICGHHYKHSEECLYTVAKKIVTNDDEEAAKESDG